MYFDFTREGKQVGKKKEKKFIILENKKILCGKK